MNIINVIAYVFILVWLVKLMSPWEPKGKALQATIVFGLTFLFGLFCMFGLRMAYSENFGVPMVGISDLINRLVGLGKTGGAVIPGLSADLFSLLTLISFFVPMFHQYRKKMVILLLIGLATTVGSTKVVQVFNITKTSTKSFVKTTVAPIVLPHANSKDFWNLRDFNVKGQNGFEFKTLYQDYDLAIAKATTRDEFDKVDSEFVEKYNKLLEESYKRRHPWGVGALQKAIELFNSFPGKLIITAFILLFFGALFQYVIDTKKGNIHILTKLCCWFLVIGSLLLWWGGPTSYATNGLSGTSGVGTALSNWLHGPPPSPPPTPEEEGYVPVHLMKKHFPTYTYGSTLRFKKVDDKDKFDKKKYVYEIRMAIGDKYQYLGKKMYNDFGDKIYGDYPFKLYAKRIDETILSDEQIRKEIQERIRYSIVFLGKEKK